MTDIGRSLVAFVMAFEKYRLDGGWPDIVFDMVCLIGPLCPIALAIAAMISGDISY
jgi:hypothetical protein